MPPIRGLLREHGFDESASKIYGSVENSDTALSAAEWTLACMPEISTKEKPGHDSISVVAVTKAHGPLRGFKTKHVPAFPSVVVFYLLTEKQVVLQDIMLASPDPEED